MNDCAKLAVIALTPVGIPPYVAATAPVLLPSWKPSILMTSVTVLASSTVGYDINNVDEGPDDKDDRDDDDADRTLAVGDNDDTDDSVSKVLLPVLPTLELR